MAAPAARGRGQRRGRRGGVNGGEEGWGWGGATDEREAIEAKRELNVVE